MLGKYESPTPLHSEYYMSINDCELERRRSGGTGFNRPSS